jgi:hypothetical protein
MAFELEFAIALAKYLFSSFDRMERSSAAFAGVGLWIASGRSA